MLRKRKYVTLITVIFLSGQFAFSQPNPQDSIPLALSLPPAMPGIEQTATLFTVREIYISGNKKTKEKFILREIPFKKGEQYQLQELVKKFEDARRQLMNTTLFHEVVVALKSFEGYNADILIEVKERWYLFPLPYFKYVDRNLNQWLFEQNARLNRANYGIKLLYNNVSGYNDKLNVWIMTGYTRQISASYDRLYIDKKMKWGMNLQLATGKTREVNYDTQNNKQLFFKDTNNFVRNFFKTSFELTYRRAIRTRHRFGIAYTEERMADTIALLNPTYFTKGRDKIRFPELYYILSYFDVDYNPYPLTGYMAEVSFFKKGFNSIVDLWQVSVKGGGNWKLANKTYFGTRAVASVKLPFKQPYFTRRMLGYSDFFLQGYEYYVIDGVAGGYIKTTLTRELLNFKIHALKKKQQSVITVPFRIFAKAYANAGYVHNPELGTNGLNNKMLYSGGIGIDILTHYDFTLKLEWSFNQLGQNGLYLHRRTFY
jgi:outer membrane protein assembly factor BamA